MEGKKIAELARQKVGAMIVTYYPGNKTGDVLESIFHQVDFALIFDNTPDTESHKNLVKVVNSVKSSQNNETEIRVFRDGMNHGLPYSYNYLLRQLESMAVEYALILDQDTILPSDAVRQYQKQYERLSQFSKVGAIGPVVSQLLKGPLDSFFDGAFSWQGMYSDKYVNERKFLINSGMFARVYDLLLIGEYDQTYFTDSLDHEISLRFRKNGYHLYEVKSIVAHHNLYNKVDIRLGKVALGFDARSPQTEYYCARDTLRTAIRYKGSFPIESLLLISVVGIKMIALLFIYPNKRIRMGYFFKGIKDVLARQSSRVS